MYRLLLVEDEQIERMYLQKIVGSHVPAITHIDEARNGQEAIQLAQHLRPDIIIMDIRMPLMNGLAACEEIRRFLPACKIVILSAFESFDYAQTAIKLCAIEYLLKPVRPRNLVNTLELTIQAIKNERLKEEEETRLKEQLREHIPLLKNSFFQDLINGEVYDEEEVRRKSVFLNIKIQPSTVFLINIKVKSAEPLSETKRQYYKQQIILKLNNYFNSDAVFIIYTGNGNYVLLHGKKEGETDAKRADIAIAEAICKFLTEKGQNIVNVGIGSLYKNILDISKSYIEAKKALLYINDTYCQAIHISDVTEEQSGINDFKKKRIFSLLTSGSKNDVINLIKDIISEARHVTDLPLYKFFFIHTFITKLFQRFDAASFQIESLKNINLISECRDFKQLERHVIECVNSLYDYLDKAKNQYYRNIIEKVQKYIEDNAENNITLDLIAKEVHLSPFYLSRLFKSETKINFITYLNILRIKKSIELLEKTDYSADLIAEKVGYNNTSYFCRIFKKHTGFTPIEWRRKRKETR